MSNKSGSNVSGDKKRPINKQALGVRPSVSQPKTKPEAYTKMDLLMLKELERMEQIEQNCRLQNLPCPVQDGPYGIDEKTGHVYMFWNGSRLYFDADGLAIK
jgi:hypothetical protein